MRRLTSLFAAFGVSIIVGCGGASGERVSSGGADESGRACAESLDSSTIVVATSLNNIAIGCDYRVTARIDVQAMLTIDPGVEIQFADQAGLVVGAGGLSAQGEAANPIILRDIPGGNGRWNGIWVIRADAPVQLEHVSLENAGAKSPVQRFDAAIDVAGADLSLTNVQINGSDSYGIVIRENVRLLQFARNQINGTDLAPLKILAEQVSSLDSDTDYAGRQTPNRVPVVEVQPTLSLRLEGARTWPALNAAYQLSGVILIAGELRLAQGARFIFKPGGFLMTDADGSLVIDGTVDQPVQMAGESGVRGEWAGLLFTDFGSALSSISHLRLADAGSVRGSFAQAAINLGAQSRLRLQNTTISNGGQWAVGCVAGASLLLGPGLDANNNTLGGIQQACQP